MWSKLLIIGTVFSYMLPTTSINAQVADSSNLYDMDLSAFNTNI